MIILFGWSSGKKRVEFLVAACRGWNREPCCLAQYHYVNLVWLWMSGTMFNQGREIYRIFLKGAQYVMRWNYCLSADWGHKAFQWVMILVLISSRQTIQLSDIRDLDYTSWKDVSVRLCDTKCCPSAKWRQFEKLLPKIWISTRYWHSKIQVENCRWKRTPKDIVCSSMLGKKIDKQTKPQTMTRKPSHTTVLPTNQPANQPTK